jgi:hypothetical protein
MALRDGIVAVKCCRKFVKFLLEALATHLQRTKVDVEQGTLPPVAYVASDAVCFGGGSKELFETPLESE